MKVSFFNLSFSIVGWTMLYFPAVAPHRLQMYMLLSTFLPFFFFTPLLPFSLISWFDISLKNNLNVYEDSFIFFHPYLLPFIIVWKQRKVLESDQFSVNVYNMQSCGDLILDCLKLLTHSTSFVLFSSYFYFLQQVLPIRAHCYSMKIRTFPCVFIMCITTVTRMNVIYSNFCVCAVG